MEHSILTGIDLQLHADGGDGGGTGGTGASGETATVAAPQKGVNPLANVQYGKQETAPVPEEQKTDNVAKPIDRNAEFEKLIKGEYKDLYDARMQDTIQKRLKSSKETVDKYNALTPMIDMLAQKYGVKADDFDALSKAIEEDDSYYEDEALERGLTVEQLKSIKKMERENADLRRQMEERQTKENADKLYETWLQQEQQTKQFYPSFDMSTEMQNEQFVNLLRCNVDVKTAFEVLHKDEIMPAAMQYTAKQVEQKVVNKVLANGMRPAENGLNAQSATVVKPDVTKLTKADRAEIARRVARGERIVF